ncbi:MAG TPA: glycosyltransferase family 39 protein [Ktedonobacteraceae bacterium]
MKRLLVQLPRSLLAALLLVPTLLLVDALCYQVRLPVSLDLEHGMGQLSAGSIHVTLGRLSEVQSLQFVAYDPLVHEYQIDGSDSTNNLNLDTGYLSTIAQSPYYRLQAWMRDLDGTSRWRDLRIQADGRLLLRVDRPANGAHFPLPAASHLLIDLQIQRPETPLALLLVQRNRRAIAITLDRNNRALTVSDADTNQTISSAFFPLDVAPFAAMVVDTLARISLWALLLLLVAQGCEMGLAGGRAYVQWIRGAQRASTVRKRGRILPRTRPIWPAVQRGGLFSRERAKLLAPLLQAIHPGALLALAGSLAYVLWIALAEYQGEPHIYDASAYVFAAKTLAQGQLTAPAPPLSQLFPGPFMVIFNGRWFAQYEPGTALTLAAGFWLHIPWLIEPLLGTLALLGIGLIAARLYDRRVATLAIVLGCLSPFYSYLAASYLSHAIALFYLVWGTWALLRFVQGAPGANLLLCGLCFGMAALTRDLVALLFIAILLPGVVLLSHKRARRPQVHRLLWWLALLTIGLLFLALYLGYNLLLTGAAHITPRNLFFAGDTWGFGQGIGFYGEHTLAAGFVNMDEILTSLQIDLFGWPFSLTLAFCAIPFLCGRANKADWLLLVALLLTVGSYIGYFYHGIYLGPRYLFEDLPFLLLLSARGILLLSARGWSRGPAHAQAQGDPPTRRPAGPSLVTLALVGALFLSNLLYYLPRQGALYHNFTGLPGTADLATDQLYHPPLHHAIVVTDDLAIYQMILFPLNDPQLQGEIIYAWGTSPDQFAQLRQTFPGRTLYLLVVNFDGSVHYLPLTP